MLRPIGDQVFLTRHRKPQVTKGGIVLAGMTRDKLDTYVGEVHSKGPLVQDEGITPGGLVVFEKDALLSFQLGDDEFVVLAEHEIYGVLDQEELDERGVVLEATAATA